MIRIDYKDRRPIYEQIVAEIEDMTARGMLEADSQLPSVRQLAMELSINPNTIQKAYSQLEKNNVIYTVKGKGNFIAGNAKDLRESKLIEIYQQIGELALRALQLGATPQMLQLQMKEMTEGGQKQ